MIHQEVKPLKTQRIIQIPNCPYNRKGCINYNSVLGRAVCQSKGNKYQRIIRCESLPFWIPNGLHIAVLRGGRLHV